MSPKAMKVSNLLSTLEEEDYNIVISFIEFLSSSRKKERAEKSKAALLELQNMFADDKGWNSEEDMLADMAEFRRERLNL